MSYNLGKTKISQMIGVHNSTPVISPARFYKSVEERDADIDNRIIGDLAIVEDNTSEIETDVYVDATESLYLPGTEVISNIDETSVLDYTKYTFAKKGNRQVHYIKLYDFVQVPEALYDLTTTIGVVSPQMIIEVIPITRNYSQVSDADTISIGIAIVAYNVISEKNVFAKVLYISPRIFNNDDIHLILFPNGDEIEETHIDLLYSQYSLEGWLKKEHCDIFPIIGNKTIYINNSVLIADNIGDDSKILGNLFKLKTKKTKEIKINDIVNKLNFNKISYHFYPSTMAHGLTELMMLSNAEKQCELAHMRFDTYTGDLSETGEGLCTIFAIVKNDEVLQTYVIASTHDVSGGIRWVANHRSGPVTKGWNTTEIDLEDNYVIDAINQEITHYVADWKKYLLIDSDQIEPKGVKSVLNPERKYIDFKEGTFVEIVQTTGQSTENVMSQKAITDRLPKDLPYFDIDLSTNIKDRNNVTQNEIYSFFGGESNFNNALQQFGEYYQGAVTLVAKQAWGGIENLICNWMLYVGNILSMQFNMSPGYGVPAIISIYLQLIEGTWTGSMIMDQGLIIKSDTLFESVGSPSLELSRDLFASRIEYIDCINEQQIKERRYIWNTVNRQHDIVEFSYIKTWNGVFPKYEEQYNHSIITLSDQQIYTSSYIKHLQVFMDTLENPRASSDGISTLIQDNKLYLISSGHSEHSEKPFTVTIVYTKK